MKKLSLEEKNKKENFSFSKLWDLSVSSDDSSDSEWLPGHTCVDYETDKLYSFNPSNKYVSLEEYLNNLFALFHTHSDHSKNEKIKKSSLKEKNKKRTLVFQNFETCLWVPMTHQTVNDF